MKAKWGRVKVQLPTFLNVALDRVEWSYSCPQLLYPPTKESWYPLNRRTGGIQNRSRHFRVEKKSVVHAGSKTMPDSLGVQPVA
jgi:hypothetical protein